VTGGNAVPQRLDLPRTLRLAGLGALGAAAGIGLLFALILLGTVPRPLGGLNWGTSAVLWISLALPIALAVGLHVVYARVLAGEARRVSSQPPPA
jgi:hypothetical protein